MVGLELRVEPINFFEETKNELEKHLLRGSLLPRKGRERLTELLRKNTRMISDSDYQDSIRFANRDERFAFTRSDEHLIANSAACFLPEIIVGKDKIIVRESLVRQAALGQNDGLVMTLIEELSHAYSQVRIITLDEIQAGSLLITPFRDSSHLLSKIETYRQQAGIGGTLDPNRVRVVNRGFGSGVQESFEENGIIKYITYPQAIIQLTLEEARACLVRLLFAAKYFGSRRKPNGSLFDQFISGVDFIVDPINKIEGQDLAIQFIIKHLPPESNLAHLIKDFLQKLYEMNPDEFRNYLIKTDPDSLHLFIEIVRSFRDYYRP